MSRTSPIIFVLMALLGCDGGVSESSSDRAAATGPKADDPRDVDDLTTFVGVLPDFATSRGVYTHRLLEELAPDFIDTLMDELGAARVVELTSGYNGPSGGWSRATSMVWTRDYLPLLAVEGGARVVLPYLSVDSNRSDYNGSQYVPVQAPSPEHRFYRGPDGVGEWRLTQTMPLLSEGGNMVATGHWVIVTDKLIRDNAKAPQDASTTALRRAGWKERTQAETLALLAKAARTPVERVIVIEPMPGEKTDHADLVVMALGPNEVLVPEVRDDILGIITFGHEIELGWRVREYLDEVASTLASKGLKVQRLPMLPPVYLKADDNEPTGYHGVFFSPTNSTQVHLEGEVPRVFLPTFDAAGFPEAYVLTMRAYEDSWVEFFEARGFVALPVDATRLGHAFGLFHCVTAPVF